MDRYPFREFLLSLQADGIRLGVRDYDRLTIALNSDDQWSLERLRQTLLILLGSDEDRRDIINRRFNKAFDRQLEVVRLDPERMKELGIDDLDVIRDDLKALRRQLAGARGDETASSKKPRKSEETPPEHEALAALEEPSKGEHWEKLRRQYHPQGRNILFGLLTALMMALAIPAAWWSWHHHLAPPRPALSLGQIELSSHDHAPASQTLSITNQGARPLEVHGASLSDPNAPFVVDDGQCAANPVPRHGSCELQIDFKPQAEQREDRDYTTQLTVRTNAGPITANLSAQATFTPKTTPEPDQPAQADNETQQPDQPTPVITPDPPPEEPPQPKTDPFKDLPLTELFNRVPVAGEPIPLGKPAPPDWRDYTQLPLIALAGLLLFLLYLAIARRLPREEPITWPKEDPNLPRRFPLEKVGGDPAPQLSNDDLAHFADSMGYFRGEQEGHRPDINASVLETVRRGGIPCLLFDRRKQLRHLIILVDEPARERRRLNPIAEELRDGLIRCGVDLSYGRFFNDPALYHGEDGRLHHLEDLEEERNRFLLLIFSDGRGIDHHATRHTFEVLQRWPHAAWFDLRAPELRDGLGVRPVKYLPCYTADPAGLHAAFNRFLTERGARDGALDPHHEPLGPQPQGDTDLAAYLQYRLGDALGWAMACALMQPMPLGLADRIRAGCFDHLPAQRIQRLAALPGGTLSDIGLRFDLAVRDELLRMLNQERRIDPKRRDEIAQFIVDQLQQAWERACQNQPDLAQGPAQYAWQAYREKVRLHLDPQNATQALCQLLASPLGESLKAEFKGEGMQRLHLPQDKLSGMTRKRLFRLQWPERKQLPLAPWHKGLAALLALATLGVSGWSGVQWQGFRLAPFDIHLEPDATVQSELAIRPGSSGEPAGEGWRYHVHLPNQAEPIPVTLGEGESLELHYTNPSVTPTTLAITPLRENQRIPITTRPEEAEATTQLVATNKQQQVLKGATLTLKRDGKTHTAPADHRIALALGEWGIKATRETGEASVERWVEVKETQNGEPQRVELYFPKIIRDEMKDGGLGPEMIALDGGTFWMGSPEDEPGRHSNEGPRHQVQLSPFAIGRYEVTFDEYDRFAEVTGREKPDDRGWGRGSRPVINVSWDDAQAYARWLSEQTGRWYRLPTEAEWEYAVRAGSQTAYSFGDNASRLGEYAWYGENAGSQTYPVSDKRPNDWGLLDVHGNVWEWVNDWFGDYPPPGDKPVQDPQGPDEGSNRVFRGGGWLSTARRCRSAYRSGNVPSNRNDGLGFRLARTDTRPPYPLTLDGEKTTEPPQPPPPGRDSEPEREGAAAADLPDSTQPEEPTKPTPPFRKGGPGGIFGDESGDSQTSPQPEQVRLTVSTTPAEAQIRIMDIAPKYEPGIQVAPGKHDIEVTHGGYQTWRQWVEISEDSTIEITLEPLQKPQPTQTAKPATSEPQQQPATVPSIQGKPSAPFHDKLKVGGYGPQMISIPAGTFLMGSENGDEDEKPVHKVSISAFSMGRYEVTFDEYDRFAEATGRKKPDDEGWGRGDRPVINVSWEDASAYAQWLSKQSGTEYRLPSEAEWEYAARAGTKRAYWWGEKADFDQMNSSGDTYWGYVGGKDQWKNTSPVGKFPRNPFGLHDTSGNVWEWVRDWYDESYYSTSRSKNPQGPEGGAARVIRGGGWDGTAGYCRSAYRGGHGPSYRNDNLGFRLARTDPRPSYPLTLGGGELANSPTTSEQTQPTPPGRVSEPERKWAAFAVFTDSTKAGSKGPEMVYIPPGSFKMGDIQGDGNSDERPVHEVTLSAYAIGRTEVTNAQYVAFLNAVGRRGSEGEPWFEDQGEDDTSRIIGPGGGDQGLDLLGFGSASSDYRVEQGYENHPVNNVSWYGAVAYAGWLSQQTGEEYRLPTEAEWERAARADTETRYSFGNDEGLLGEYAWFSENSDYKLHEVAKKKANDWGLYDVHSNLWEWVSDWYDSNYYAKRSAENPQGPDGGSLRVIRGGSWLYPAQAARSANRDWYGPGNRGNFVGFRLARTVP